MMVAFICLEGHALSWFQWVDVKSPFQSWHNFHLALLIRFNHLGDEDPTEQLLGLCKVGLVEEFRDQSETLLAALPQLPESVLK